MIKISAEKLQEIIASHGKWLKNEKGGRNADLQYADLRGADLQYANLRNADLQYANLRNADLRGADLRGADLQYANLQYADLRGADLRGADLQYADLRGANLRDADLQYADLRGANLRDGMYQIVGCGSNNRCTTYDSINNRIICGCWNDDKGNTLASFEQRVEDTYGANSKEPNKFYYDEYMAAIAFFKAIKE